MPQIVRDDKYHEDGKWVLVVKDSHGSGTTRVGLGYRYLFTVTGTHITQDDYKTIQNIPLGDRNALRRCIRAMKREAIRRNRGLKAVDKII